MECPSCGRELEQGSDVCPGCGLRFESDPTVAFVPVSDRRHPALSPEAAADVQGFTGHALVVERGPTAGMTYVLQRGVTTVGRHPSSGIFLDDITVSRHHCRFTVGTDTFEIEDSGSTNGTYVNGARVDRSSLEPGDEVLIGRFHLIVAHGHE